MTPPRLALKLPQLRLVATILARGQLGLAAEELGLTQPAASRMLAETERLVGGPIFERTAKGMVPTPLGVIVGRRARSVTAELQDLAAEVSDQQQGLAGIVRVGAVTSPAVGYLVPAIRRLRAASPRVEVRVDVAPSTLLQRALAAGELDFMIGRLMPDSDPADYVVLPGRPEPVRFLVRQGHPLAGGGPVGLAQLAAHDWIVQERGTPIRTAVEAALLRARLRLPEGVVATSSLLVMMALLAQSDAVAPVGREVTELLIADPIRAGFAVLPTTDPVELPFYHVISPAGRSLSRAAQRLRTLVQEAMGEHPGR